MYEEKFSASNDVSHNLGIFRAIIEELDLGGQSVLDLVNECDSQWCTKEAIEHIMSRTGYEN